MVLSVTHPTAFVEDGSQVGIPHDTVNQLHNEGISVVANLIDLDKTEVNKIAANLRCPAGIIPYPNPGYAPGATIPTPPLIFGSKSHNLLVVAAKLLRYYEPFGRHTSTANVKWDPLMNTFNVQLKALRENKNRDESEVPNTTKAMPVIK